MSVKMTISFRNPSPSVAVSTSTFGCGWNLHSRDTESHPVNMIFRLSSDGNFNFKLIIRTAFEIQY